MSEDDKLLLQVGGGITAGVVVLVVGAGCIGGPGAAVAMMGLLGKAGFVLHMLDSEKEKARQAKTNEV